MCDEKIDDCCITWRKRNLFMSMHCVFDVTHFIGFAAHIFPISILFTGPLLLYPLLALQYWHQYWLYLGYTPQTQGREPHEKPWDITELFYTLGLFQRKCHSLLVHSAKRNSSPWNQKLIKNLCFYVTIYSLSVWKYCSCAVEGKI